ncbi:MAG: ABC transporter substrate-binding protein, partial [Mycobacterium sp.]|nr:ABC transporter substrate-binding protein [Mycobacterium sp.]
MNGLGQRLAAALLAATTAIAMSGCVSRPGSEASGGEGGVIRFTFAPDPVWDYITDQGILAEMEEQSGFTIDASSTWDEFGVFAGGHADIVSSASYEVPVIEQETGRDTVVIGKYNMDRSVIIA